MNGTGKRESGSQKKPVVNRFEKSEMKPKVPAGGHPEKPSEEQEVKIGQTEETAPVVQQEAPAAQNEVPKEIAPEVAEEVSQKAEDKPQEEAVQQPREETVQQPKGGVLTADYVAKQMKEPESRNVRLQAVITPSVNNKLNEMAKSGEIKSKNDLINFLLEKYLEESEGK